LGGVRDLDQDLLREDSGILIPKASNPERGCISQPRVAVLGYPGTSIAIGHNPTGVVPVMVNDETWRRSLATSAGRNPFRVAAGTGFVLTCSIVTPSPRVASTQPWAERFNPFGVCWHPDEKRTTSLEVECL